MGPVTEIEYGSRQERYDEKLVENVGLSKDAVSSMAIGEKIRALYDHRQDQYQKLADAVYFRRGWTQNGVPTPQKMRELGFGDESGMLAMLQERIDEDAENGLNVWGGRYSGDGSAPSDDPVYWEKL
jgi:aldehyde:ferredoxin oxidoreductase